jgi:hypothetical protein
VLIICLSRLVVQKGRYILVGSEVLTASTVASRLLQLLFLLFGVLLTLKAIPVTGHGGP